VIWGSWRRVPLASGGGRDAARALPRNAVGMVLIAEGVSEYAPNDPALVNFHEEVHFGEPQDQLSIERIFMNEEDCSRFGPLVSAH